MIDRLGPRVGDRPPRTRPRTMVGLLMTWPVRSMGFALRANDGKIAVEAAAGGRLNSAIGTPLSLLWSASRAPAPPEALSTERRPWDPGCRAGPHEARPRRLRCSSARLSTAIDARPVRRRRHTLRATTRSCRCARPWPLADGRTPGLERDDLHAALAARARAMRSDAAGVVQPFDVQRHHRTSSCSMIALAASSTSRQVSLPTLTMYEQPDAAALQRIADRARQRAALADDRNGRTLRFSRFLSAAPKVSIVLPHRPDALGSWGPAPPRRACRRPRPAGARSRGRPPLPRSPS